jgi:hypothetical protein
MTAPENDLDRIIDAALREEPFREPPRGFGARLERRLTLEALRLEEERSFRWRVASAGFGAVSMTLGLCALAVVLSRSGLVGRILPGGMGYVDYWAASATRLWAESAPHVVGLTGVLVAVILASLAALPMVRAAFPRERRLR